MFSVESCKTTTVTPFESCLRRGFSTLQVKLPDTERGFVLLPRRWVVERSFAWLSRFRRLVRDYERLPETLKGLHFLAFARWRIVSFKLSLTVHSS
jgi:transposase